MILADMKDITFAFFCFIIIWALLFFLSLAYQNDFHTIKRIIMLDHNAVSRVQFWMGFLISLIIAIIISITLI